MTKHYQYSIGELDNMIPWEREIYISLLIQNIEEETERMNNNQR
jgi:hypothetical protein